MPTSYTVTNEPMMFLDVSITSTQTTGIILSSPQLNNVDHVFGSLSGGILRIRSGFLREDIYYATATIGADNRVTLATGVVRNVDPSLTTTIVTAGNGLLWGKGAIVELIQDARLFNLSAKKDTANTLTGVNTFGTGGAVRFSGTDTSGLRLKSLTTAERDALTAANGDFIYNTTTGVVNQYVAGAWAAVGTDATANGSTTVAGKYEEATVAEQGTATATGATGARLVPAVANLVKTSSGAGDENKIAVLNSAGNFAIGFIPSSISASINPAGAVILWTTASAPTGYLLCDGAEVSRTTYSTLFGVISTTYGIGDNSTTFNVPNFTSRIALGAGTGSKVWTISAVDTGTEYLTVPSNTSLYTGQAVVYTAASPATGLTSTTTYYVIRISATQVQLATTLAEAIAGTAINLTGAGSGTQTLTQTLTARTVGAIGGEESHALTIAETPAHTHTYAVGSSDAGATMAADGTTNSANPATSSTGGSTAHNIMPPFLVLSYIIKT